MKRFGVFMLGALILFTLIGLNHTSTPEKLQVDDKGEKVTIYADGKVIHTYEKYVKVIGDEVIFKNDYTEMKFKNAKVKYGE
ncbi:Uncharacterised protein [[Flavobacterium] thermophilum]|nr:Uncharacterised protein [[Flavobacterium] thermophilum]